MAAYFTGGGGTDIQAADGLQTLYLMNPGYAGFTADPNNSAADHAHPTNMVLLNSMTSLNPVTLSTQMSPTGSPHIVGIPLQHEAASRSPTQPQPQPHVQYNLWAQQQQQGASNNPAQQGGLSLTLSSRELSVPASAIAPTQLATASSSSGGMHMPGGYMMSGSKYLKAAQELLDEVVSVGKVGAKVVDSGKGASSSTGKLGSGKKDNKEELAEMSASGREEDKKPAAVELTTAERQEMQMKKAKLVNMLDEVEQRYRQYHHQMQVIASSFEAVAGPGSARTYTSLALQTISKQFRCLRDAITAQIRSTSKSLGEEESKTVGSRLRFIDHQLRQQRALQQLGMVQHNAWRPQRGLPERSVSILRAWLFEHFLHPYPKDSDKIMLAKQTGLTRSQVSNWFINARVRLWKPMVEEMYLEETKDQEKDVDNTDAGENSSGNTDITDKNPINSNSATQQNSIGSKLAQQQNTLTNSINQIHSAAMLTDHQPESFYAAAHDEELMPQQKVKRVRCEEEAYQPGMVASSVGVDQPRHHHHEQVNNRELLMKFMEEGARVGFGSTAGYTMAAAADPMARLINPEQFAPHMSYGGNNGVVSLTLGLPHCDTHMPMSGAHHQQSFLSSNDVGIRLEMGTEANVDYCSSLGGNSAPVVTVAPHTTSNAAYDIDLQSRKPFSAHLMRDFVA